MKSYLKLMRVHHYIKNILIFAAIVCGGELFCREKLIRVVLGFIVFSLTSSAIYIVNDIRDRENDRCHPTKCNRPIASGRIPVKNAVLLTIVLLGGSFLINHHITPPPI